MRRSSWRTALLLDRCNLGISEFSEESDQGTRDENVHRRVERVYDRGRVSEVLDIALAVSQPDQGYKSEDRQAKRNYGKSLECQTADESRVSLGLNVRRLRSLTPLTSALRPA